MDFFAETELDGEPGSFGADVQLLQDTTTLSDGRSVALYHMNSDPSLTIQFFDIDGQPEAPPISLAQYLSAPYGTGQIVGLEGGGFAVAWVESNGSTQKMGVRLFDDEGNPTSNKITFGSGYASTFDLAATPDGGFLAAWTEGATTNDGIQVSRFDADGDKIGREVNVGDGHDVEKVGIAKLADGNIGIVWTGKDGPNTASVFVSVLDANLNIVTGPDQVIDSSQYFRSEADIAPLAGGGFAISWAGRPAEGGDSNIWTMVFDATGTATTDAIAMPGEGAQERTSIVELGDGGFMVVWKTQFYHGGIFAQRYDAEGNEVNETLRLDDGGDWTYIPHSLTTGSGNVVGLWNNTGTETIGYQIIAYSADANGTDAAEVFSGGGMADHFLAGGGNDTVSAGDGDDTVHGDGGDDRLYGEDGNDRIDGGTGGDTIGGGAGADTINGGDGYDVIEGGGGNDRIFGDNGNDLLSGDGGNDILYGDVGNDTLNGGAGNDTANYFGSAAAVTLNLTTGGSAGQAKGDSYLDIEHVTGSKRSDDIIGDDADNRLKGMDGWDTLSGGAGNDTLEGGGGNDKLYGDDGDDVLSGGGRSDQLSGGDGNDTLTGSAGFDTLTGDAGDDVLTGGFHADKFVFAAGSGNDTITDFETNKDSLDLSETTTDFTDLASVQAAATDTAEGLLIDLGGGDSVLLTGVTMGDLATDNFIF